MDLRKIKKLMELLEESGIAEIEVKEGEESIKLSRNISTIKLKIFSDWKLLAITAEKTRISPISTAATKFAKTTVRIIRSFLFFTFVILDT